MAGIVEHTPPEGSLIDRYTAAEGHYTDGFTAQVPVAVSLADYIDAFYATPLFRAELLVLRLAGHGAAGSDRTLLASGAADRFAAWTVEDRREDEILLSDHWGRTKSWLCVAPDDAGTRLWFGSVVVPVRGRDGDLRLGRGYAALIGAHRLYSRLLLSAAARRLKPPTHPPSARQ